MNANVDINLTEKYGIKMAMIFNMDISVMAAYEQVQLQQEKNKGLSTEGICTSPMLPGWKLKLSVKFIFNEFITNKEKILNLATSMLDEHIDDSEGIKEDNTELIHEKESAVERLTKRLSGLTEMRADGEITKAVFLEKQSEIQETISKLKKEISKLQSSPNEDDIPENGDDATHEEKITLLKYYMEKAVTVEEGDIPEDVIRAFVEKIIVHENSLDWYLRFRTINPDGTTELLQTPIKGITKREAQFSSLRSLQHRLQLTKAGNNNFEKLYEFTIRRSDAEEHFRKHCPKQRIYKWSDLKIIMYI